MISSDGLHPRAAETIRDRHSGQQTTVSDAHPDSGITNINTVEIPI